MAGSHPYHHLTNTCFYKKVCPALKPRAQRAKCPRRIPKPQKKRDMHSNMNHLSLPASFPNLEIGKRRAQFTELLTCSGGGGKKMRRISHHSSPAMCPVLYEGIFYVYSLLLLSVTMRLQKRKLIFKEISNIIRGKRGRG